MLCTFYLFMIKNVLLLIVGYRIRLFLLRYSGDLLHLLFFHANPPEIMNVKL